MNERHLVGGLRVRFLFLALILAGSGLGILAWARLQLSRQEQRREKLWMGLKKSPSWNAAVTEPGEIVLIAQVEGWEPGPSDTPVHAVHTRTLSRFWIVRLAVIATEQGDYPPDECNVLTHSPFDDFGIKSKGQKFQLVLRARDGSLEFLHPHGTTPPKIVWAFHEGPYELVSHQEIW